MEKMGKQQLGSRLEDELLNYILGTPVDVGEKIPNEFELAEQFGVGRSTVREAVKGLVTRGILEVRRGAGTFVVSHHSLKEDPLGLTKLEDKYKLALELFELRLMMEPEIASLAAQKAGDGEKVRLQELCLQVEELYSNEEDHLARDVEFHTHIARCSQNRVVEMLVPLINSAVTTFGSLTHRKLKQETIETHRAITDAIVKGDSVGAKCAMIMHLTYNRQMLVKMMEEYGEEHTKERE
ncbi:MAG: FadR family transcriptional regulator [Hungatella sp.]|nr:FadR family transcriptional regulator [Hungatella sp.]